MRLVHPFNTGGNMSDKEYDVVVIGAGPDGVRCAERTEQAIP